MIVMSDELMMMKGRFFKHESKIDIESLLMTLLEIPENFSP